MFMIRSESTSKSTVILKVLEQPTIEMRKTIRMKRKATELKKLMEMITLMLVVNSVLLLE